MAVVTDGTAVLGLGDIGPEAGMPVMEGKCALFKAFAGMDAFPLCVRSKDVDEIVHTVDLLAGSFGGINLEDIGAPRCFEIERKLKERLRHPGFPRRPARHRRDHRAAAMLNALKLVGKDIEEVSAVVITAPAPPALPLHQAADGPGPEERGGLRQDGRFGLRRPARHDPCPGPAGGG